MGTVDQETPLILTAAGRRVSKAGAQVVLQGVFQELQLDGRPTAHTMRVTVAQAMAAAGVDK